MTFKEEKLKEFKDLLSAYRLRIEQQRTPNEEGADSATQKVNDFFSQALNDQKARVLEKIEKYRADELDFETNRDKTAAPETESYAEGATNGYCEALNDLYAAVKEL